MYFDFNDMVRSVLWIGRNIRVLYDRELQRYHIGWAQQFLLLHIYHHPGVTAQTLIEVFQSEKSTISKGVKRLQEEGYIRIETDEEDRRSKKLYPTEAAGEVVVCIGAIQKNLCRKLSQIITEPEKLQAEETLKKFGLVFALDKEGQEGEQ